MYRRFALPLILAFSAPALAWPAEPLVLRQSGKWEMNYGEDACNLMARFGEGDSAIAARFTRYEPGDAFELALYGKRLKLSDPRADMRIGFGLAEEPALRTAVLGDNNDMPLMIFSSLFFTIGAAHKDGTEWPAITSQQEASVSRLDLDGPGFKPVRIELGSMAKPMEAMRACTANLVRYWGFDPDVQAHLSRAPAPLSKPHSWLRPSDYPKAALVAGHNGLVRFRLNVDETGAVAGCRVLFRSSPDDFADRTCQIVSKRAKFSPALDAQGKPVKSFFVETVHWQVH